MNEHIARVGKIIEALRICGAHNGCDGCPYSGKYAFNDCAYVLNLDAADAIEELLKLRTPMPVRVTTSTKRCPSCNKQVSGIGNIHGNYRFCRWCGQALDWAEPPKGVE